MTTLCIDFGPVPHRWDHSYSAFNEVIHQPKLVYEQQSIELTAVAEATIALLLKKSMW